MSDVSTINTPEEIIEVPSYLSDSDYGIALTATDCDPSCEGLGERCSSSEDCSDCQSECQHACEDGCELRCEKSSQCSGCEGTCETASTCQDYCQSNQGCTNCQTSCQTGASCQSSCQDSCQNCQVACELSSQRPNNWTWVTNVSIGAQILFTADEWNGFTARINEFRTYKDLSSITFTSAVKGEYIKASHIAEAWDAINDMSPPSVLPEKVVSGSRVTAISLNGLVASLNSIL